jgi:membrane protein
VMIVSISWSAVQAAAQPAVELTPSARWHMTLALNMTINFLLFAAIYRFVPKTHIRWSEAFSGACVAAVLWEVGRQVLAIYLVRHSHFSAYGVIGSFLAIMLWMYYAMLVVFFGAEFIRAALDADLQKRE